MKEVLIVSIGILLGQCPQDRAGGKYKKRGESRCWI